MIYVISDIHGEYEKYRAMLEKIRFSPEDTLYVLGDVIDRGAAPVKVLWDMAMRPNVIPILGNHELFALEVLPVLLSEVTEERIETEVTADFIDALGCWRYNGGDATIAQLKALPAEYRSLLLEYLEEFAPYALTKTAQGGKFLLVHGGLRNYSPERELDEYTLEDFTYERPAPGQRYFDGKLTVVVGHTPTQILCGEPRIYKDENVIYIDCGAAFGGRLGCLCLDTMEEFYI